MGDEPSVRVGSFLLLRCELSERVPEGDELTRRVVGKAFLKSHLHKCLTLGRKVGKNVPGKGNSMGRCGGDGEWA